MLRLCTSSTECPANNSFCSIASRSAFCFASASTCSRYSLSLSTIKRYASDPSIAGRPQTLHIWSCSISSIVSSFGRYHGSLVAPPSKAPLISFIASSFPCSAAFCVRKSSFWRLFSLLKAELFDLNSCNTGGNAHRTHNLSNNAVFLSTAAIFPLIWEIFSLKFFILSLTSL